MASVLVCIPVPQESDTEGSGPGRIQRKEGRECALLVVKLRKQKFPEWGRWPPLVLITEAEVGTEYLSGNF